jgi:hypothetical protein
MKKTVLTLAAALCMLAYSGCTKDTPNIYATLYGVVTDSETAEPLSGAAVTLSPGGKNRTTGDDGAFEFADLDAQQYTITVQKPDYQTNRKTVTAVAAERTEANIPLTKSN